MQQRENGMTSYDFDLITLGAGSGGVRASRLAGSYGAKVAVVEKSRVGGTCVMRGCVPKKLLVYASQFSDAFEDSLGFGWRPGPADFDWPVLISAKNLELKRLEGVYQRILRDNGVTLIEGQGVLLDPHTVQVGAKTYTAEKILIATGGRPELPELPGIEHAITSDQALDLMDLPRSIVIVGGGYIAVEFAGIFNGLGCAVTEVVRAGNILRGFDEDVRETLSAEMEKRGVTICRDTVIQSIEKLASGGYSLRLAGGDGTCDEELKADLVMYATGRRPNTDGLGLVEAGVKLTPKGAVAVDAEQRSSVDNIFAVGDCTDRINLTPVAIAEGRAFAETQFHGTPTTVDYTNVPSAVFSAPPISSVGLTEAKARETFDNVDVYLTRFKPMRNTLAHRDERNMMKLIVDRDSDKVVGAHMVGSDAPEIVQGLAIALKAGATKAHFDSTLGIHPTAAEEFVTLRDLVAET